MKKEIIRKITLAIAASMVGMAASAFITYEVKRGDTIYGLSNKYKITADDLIKYNPSVKNGLKAGAVIRIPESSDLHTEANEAEDVTVTELTPEGTNFDTSVAQSEAETELYELPVNETKTEYPASSNIERDAAREDTRIEENEINSLPSELPAADRLDVGTNRYVARFGDTMHSISRKTGVEEALLISLNPLVDANHVPEGEIIRLTADAPYGTMRTDLTLPDSVIYRVMTQGNADANSYSPTKEVGVAVMMPFDLKHDVVGKQALLATEFYKGFMLATREQAPDIDYSLRIYAIDTSETSDLQKELNMLKDKGVNVIIPPDDEAQLKEIERFVATKGDGITVFNVLNVKDDGYLDNPNVVQCNISQKLMYSKALKALQTYYSDYIPVVLNLAGGKDEKSGFVEMLREDYEAKNKKVIELSFNEYLKESDLSELKPDYKYIFIPKSGSQDVFDKISETILSQIENDPSPDRLKLFGYPDWVVLRGNSKEALHRIGAVIYSRFSFENSDPAVREMNTQFRNWYGHVQTDVFPAQGTLGYDAANLLYKMLDNDWLGKSASQYQVGSHSGLQSTFRLVRPGDGGGIINDTLYIIEFLPGEGTYIRTL